ncbi:MAG: serine hydrolase domain-containing protein [Candidatus Hodarchaeota archaeon]
MNTITFKIEDLDRIVEDSFKNSHLPGLAVGVLKDGDLVYSKGFGKADIKNNVPVTADTLFRMASVTKLFTAVGLMQHWEGKKFDLDDPVNQYLPKGKIVVKKGWPDVTFRHLFTHRSGIGELLKASDVFKPGFGTTVIGRKKSIPPLSSLHEKDIHPNVRADFKYAYSNIGFSVLGYLIEIFCGKSFRDYLVEKVLDPLGMVNSDFELCDKVEKHEAIGYLFRFGKHRVAKYYKNIIKPAGSLYSSVNDMARFARMLLEKGTFEGKNLLEPETLDLMWTPQYWSHDALKEQASIGLCFHVYHVNGKKIVEHGGATSGHTTAFSLIPSENIAVIVLSNLDEIFGSRVTVSIKNKLIQCILDMKEPEHLEEKYDEIMLNDIKGYYGSYDGVLTNTRVLMAAGDYKVGLRKGKPYLSSLYGGKRKGSPLYSTDDPLVYEYELGEGAALRRTSKVAFERGEDGKVSSMSIGFFKLRKNPFVNTLRFKCYTLVTVIIAILILLLMLKIPFY